MIPKEKATELISKYMEIDLQPFSEYGDYMEKDAAKKIALIVIDEMIDFEKMIINQLHKITKNEDGEFKVQNVFWIQVKEEIEKL
jgi:uncharacterized protein YutE (UPF0331/DUF86 family)